MAMLGYNLSNPDRPSAHGEMAKTAVAVAEDALKELKTSHLMSCRIYTVFGMTHAKLANPGSVYSNLGDWLSLQAALKIALDFGESSVGAVDYGLYSYVFLNADAS